MIRMKEDILFCEKREDNYPVDSLVLNMFERIKPEDRLEDHCSLCMYSVCVCACVCLPTLSVGLCNICVWLCLTTYSVCVTACSLSV